MSVGTGSGTSAQVGFGISIYRVVNYRYNLWLDTVTRGSIINDILKYACGFSHISPFLSLSHPYIFLCKITSWERVPEWDPYPKHLPYGLRIRKLTTLSVFRIRVWLLRIQSEILPSHQKLNCKLKCCWLALWQQELQKILLGQFLFNADQCGSLPKISVLWIRDIFVRIRDSCLWPNGSGSCYYRPWPSSANKKLFFLLITFWIVIPVPFF